MKHREPRHPRSRGLALAMIVLMIGVLVVAAGVAFPDIMPRIDARTADETSDRMAGIETAIRSYARDHLAVPASLDELGTPTGRAKWKGPYVERGIEGYAGDEADYRRDNWSREYEWKRHSARRGTLRSTGPNGTSGDADDIVRDIDIGDILEEITLAWLARINVAITNYNQRYGKGRPLAGPPSAIIRLLKNRRLLPSSTSNTDAFGSSWISVGNPVRSFRSRNAR